MVKYCCIKNCNSGRLKAEKVSIFRVPPDPAIYKLWEEAVTNSGNVLTRRSYVCAKHFRDEDVRKEKILRDDSGTIYYRRSMDRVKLHPMSVPSIFSGFETKSQGSPADCQRYETYFYESFSPCASPTFEVVKCEKIEKTLTQNVTHVVVAEEKLLNEIFTSYKNINLPNTQWASFLVELPKKMLVFSQINVIDASQEVKTPITIKQVTLQEDGKFRIFIYNRLLCIAECETSIKELENLIQTVDGFNPCAGGPNIEEFTNVLCDEAFKDMSGKWRHILCALVLEKGSRCNKCMKLDYRLKHLSVQAAKKENILKSLKFKSVKEQKLEIRSKVFAIVKETF